MTHHTPLTPAAFVAWRTFREGYRAPDGAPNPYSRAVAPRHYEGWREGYEAGRRGLVVRIPEPPRKQNGTKS